MSTGSGLDSETDPGFQDSSQPGLGIRLDDLRNPSKKSQIYKHHISLLFVT